MATLIIDFDSTIASVESMEVLLESALKDNLEKVQILEEVKEITRLGMEGVIPFSESLQKRVQLLPLNTNSIHHVAVVLKDFLTPSFITTLSHLKTHTIYIVSCGFKELIDPLLIPLGIKERNIFANQFVFNGTTFLGVDTSLPLSQNQGKVKTVQNLELSDDNVYIIGDGYTDYEIKKEGLAKKFIYYGEHVRRENVMQLADHVIYSFDELLKIKL